MLNAEPSTTNLRRPLHEARIDGVRTRRGPEVVLAVGDSVIGGFLKMGVPQNGISIGEYNGI